MTSTIQQLTLELSLALKKHRFKLTTAESCTGGGLAYYLTDVPGSSAWFERGLVTYSNTSKEELLNVQSSTLSTFGAVSEQTAREMAEGALKNSPAQISIAITGIAGPEGGSVDKPVGTVWFSCAGIDQKTEASVNIFEGNREEIRLQAIKAALEKLVDFILR